MPVLRDRLTRPCSRATGYPQFGFVALRQVRNPGMVAPQRSWHGATYVLSRGAEEFEQTWQLANGGKVATWAGERGKLIAISEGRNGSRVPDLRLVRLGDRRRRHAAGVASAPAQGRRVHRAARLAVSGAPVRDGPA